MTYSLRELDGIDDSLFFSPKIIITGGKYIVSFRQAAAQSHSQHIHRQQPVRVIRSFYSLSSSFDIFVFFVFVVVFFSSSFLVRPFFVVHDSILWRGEKEPTTMIILL